MSVQDDEAVTQFYFLYFYLIVRGQTDLHDREHANADLRENLRELRRLMMEGTEEVEVRRARGIRIINLHEERVTRHFGFSMDGPEKKSEDEIRAEARAAELKKKGPVYGPPKPPEMA